MSVKHIFHGGNGSTDPDGFPFAVTPSGAIYCVQDDGDLRFFRYTGTGEHDPTGTLGFDGPNQGNTIGNGFDSLLHFVGGGDGIILGVKPDGDLIYFQYTGRGESDPTGTNGFDGANQGTVIGNGFHTVSHLCTSPREGQTTQPQTTIFIVDENGDLRWFRYSGFGEHDPTGTLGFDQPNQGNQIGNGFGNLLHLAGFGGGAFLAVPENGDLLWFRYTGNGEHDPTGASGFVGNNSGNQIGNGFQNVRHIFGGFAPDGRGRILHVITEDGRLLYFRYDGNGEHDPTGTLGFESPNQGNQIGRGF